MRISSRVRVRFFFRWYDIWVGVYVYLEGRVVYVCPVPMFGFAIEWEGTDD